MDSLWRRANARNVSFSIFVRWSIYINNAVDKPNWQEFVVWYFSLLSTPPPLEVSIALTLLSQSSVGPEVSDLLTTSDQTLIRLNEEPHAIERKLAEEKVRLGLGRF